MDYALVADLEGVIVAHQADCPVARKAAVDGWPVMTLLDCRKLLPRDIPKHACLDNDRQRAG